MQQCGRQRAKADQSQKHECGAGADQDIEPVGCVSAGKQDDGAGSRQHTRHMGAANDAVDDVDLAPAHAGAKADEHETEHGAEDDPRGRAEQANFDGVAHEEDTAERDGYAAKVHRPSGAQALFDGCGQRCGWWCERFSAAGKRAGGRWRCVADLRCRCRLRLPRILFGRVLFARVLIRRVRLTANAVGVDVIRTGSLAHGWVRCGRFCRLASRGLVCRLLLARIVCGRTSRVMGRPKGLLAYCPVKLIEALRKQAHMALDLRHPFVLENTARHQNGNAKEHPKDKQRYEQDKKNIHDNSQPWKTSPPPHYACRLILSEKVGGIVLQHLAERRESQVIAAPHRKAASLDRVRLL